MLGEVFYSLSLSLIMVDFSLQKHHNAGTCTWTRYPSTRRMIQYNSKPWDGKKTNKRHSPINRQKNHSIIFLGRSNTCTC